MTHQTDPTTTTVPGPSRRTKRLLQFGIPAVLVAGAVAGVLVATNQPSGQQTADAAPSVAVVSPSVTATSTTAPAPKPTASKKAVLAKPKAKTAPKATTTPTEGSPAGTGEAQTNQAGTGTGGQVPQAGGPAQSSTGGGSSSNGGSAGGSWAPAPAAPAPAAPAPAAPKPAAPKPAPPAPAPAPQPPVQENHYPPQSLGSINSARVGLGAPGFLPYTGGCVPVASAWASSLDGAEGYVQHPDVVGYARAGMKIAGTFSLDGQVNGRSGTLTVYSCP